MNKLSNKKEWLENRSVGLKVMNVEIAPKVEGLLHPCNVFFLPGRRALFVIPSIFLSINSHSIMNENQVIPFYYYFAIVQ